jgi:hypothetical protein
MSRQARNGRNRANGPDGVRSVTIGGGREYAHSGTLQDARRAGVRFGDGDTCEVCDAGKWRSVFLLSEEPEPDDVRRFSARAGERRRGPGVASPCRLRFPTFLKM